MRSRAVGGRGDSRGKEMEDDIRDELCDLMMELSRRLWSLQELLLARPEPDLLPRTVIIGHGLPTGLSSSALRS